MPRLVTYRCPDCEGEFDFLHHPSDEPPPERCELCNAWMGDEPEKAPVLHLKIATERNRVPDQVYRKMESASIARAEDAAAMTGATVAEMGDMKITNLKDNSRAGDISAVTSSRTAKAMSELTVRGSGAAPGFQNPQASQWAGETTSGPSALSGRAAISALQSGSTHLETLAAVTRNGQMGKF